MDSDSSLDSELLRGAKGGSRKRKKADSDYEESEESVSLEDESELEEEEAPRSKKKGSGQKPARKRPARRGGRRASPSEDEDEDEDDFEAEAAAASGRGGGRSRGRQQQESSDDEDRLQIDEEDLIEDEEDRKRLAAMTELQREFVLAERADKRNAELLRQKLLKKSDAKAAAAGAKAAKSVRGKSGREERVEADKKRAIEELKAARERKKEGAEERRRKEEESEDMDDEDEEGEAAAAERRAARRRERERSPSEEGALDSDEALSDEDRGGYGRRYEEGEDEDEAPVEDVRKIQVRRERLAEWLNEPFFEDTLPGCMVKVAVPGEYYGPDGMPAKRYLLCQVLTVETRPPGVYKDPGQRWPSPYRFGPAGKEDKTHKWLVLERGGSQRYYPMALVSNTGFTDYEFESWQRALKDAGRPQVSRRVARDVHERMVKAVEYTYTAADVNRLLKEKRAKGQAPRNVALERARLENELSHARETNDEEKVAELEAALAQLAGLAAEVQQAKRRGADLASLNKRNAEANFKAALDNVSNKVGSAAGWQGGAETGRLDPFSRRATRPIIYWSTGRKAAAAEEEEAAAQQEAAAAAANGDAAAAAEEEDLSPEEQKRRARRGGLDLDAIVDLSGLDLSILQRPARMPPLARKLLGPTWRPAQPPPGARVVSLEEFKRERGMA